MNKKNDFNIRTLTAKDIFPMAKIISLCGLADLKKCFINIDNNADYRMAGICISIEIASIVCANIGKCEKELMQFISSLTDIEQEELGSMPPAKFAEIINSIIKKEEFRDFFTELSKLFWQEK